MLTRNQEIQEQGTSSKKAVNFECIARIQCSEDLLSYKKNLDAVVVRGVEILQEIMWEIEVQIDEIEAANEEVPVEMLEALSKIKREVQTGEAFLKCEVLIGKHKHNLVSKL